MTTFDVATTQTSSAFQRLWQQAFSSEHAADLERQRAAREGQPPLPRVTSESVAWQARALVRAAGGRCLTERESRAILALYGIRTTREILVPSFERAVEAAQEIGYPVTVKAEWTVLAPPAEPDAATLNITDETGLKRGFKRALAGAWATVPWDSINGVLVQEMLAPGTDILVGMTSESRYGPVLAWGLATADDDAPDATQLLLPPCSVDEARSLLDMVSADPDGLADMLARFSELCLDVRDVVHQIEMRLLISAKPGDGGRTVDCVIVPADA